MPKKTTDKPVIPAKKSSVDWLSYIEKLRTLDKHIAVHKRNGHVHSIKAKNAEKAALLKEISDLRKSRGL